VDIPTQMDAAYVWLAMAVLGRWAVGTMNFVVMPVKAEAVGRGCMYCWVLVT
jgi:hypothetical protein